MTRIACATPNCLRDILPETAQRTGGYCMPCIQQQEREAHAAYIAANRRIVDRFAGLSDPLQILIAHYDAPRYDELIEQAPCPQSIASLVLQLDNAKQDQLILTAQQCLPDDPDLACLLAILHLQLTGRGDASFQQALLDMALADEELPYQAAPLFSGAVELAEQLLAASQAMPENEPWLDALAWSRAPVAIDYLARCGKRGYYALLSSGGWLNADGQLLELTLPQSHLLTLGDEQAPVASWQQLPLGLYLPEAPTEFVLAFNLEQLKQGESRQRTGARKHCKTALSDWWFPTSISLSGSTASGFHGTQPELGLPRSKLGGHPFWEQDIAEWPLDHKNIPMRFLGQLCMDDLGSEGTFYLFASLDWDETAVIYQQT